MGRTNKTTLTHNSRSRENGEVVVCSCEVSRDGRRGCAVRRGAMVSCSVEAQTGAGDDRPTSFLWSHVTRHRRLACPTQEIRQASFCLQFPKCLGMVGVGVLCAMKSDVVR